MFNKATNINDDGEYKDLTKKLVELIKKYKQINIVIPERRLNYALDKDKNKYKNYYFEKDDSIKEEIRYQKLIERYTGYKTYLNPKTYTQYIKTPDFWLEDVDELWDLKGIDGNAKDIVNNILHKASKQTYNVILKQRDTLHSIKYLDNRLEEIFKNNKRKGIRKVILIDRNDNIIRFYKR